MRQHDGPDQIGVLRFGSSASQRSFGDGRKEAVGTLPVWVAPPQRAAPLPDQRPPPPRADRRSFQSKAGLITAPASSSTTAPCC